MLTPQLFSMTEIACPNCVHPIGETILYWLTKLKVQIEGISIDCPKCQHKLDINAYFSVEDEEEGK